MRYVLTLVHGTGARGAAWTQPNSPLREALERHLGSVRFEVFDWSGKNDQADRLDAGKQLALRLAELGKEEPEAKRIVIGHSHGGNVALYAQAQGAAAHGLVCLSTPFLAVRERRIPGLSSSLSVIAVGLGFGLAALVAVLSGLGIGAFIATLLAVIVAVGVAQGITKRRMKGRAAVICKDFEVAAPEVPTFIVRGNRDEAAGALSVAQTVVWGMVGTWAHATAKVASLTGGSVAPEDGEPRPPIPVLAISAACQLLVALPILPIAVLSGLFLWFFSPQLLTTALLVEISVEPVPVGEWEVMQLDASGAGRAHSQAYSDPRSLARIGRWIGESTG